ncbi:hypothetical protein LIER_42230 [Lithospermum erythrorhizon]|uniref:Uncharacterized protein n=1 Tax=Lithospermum erythrorhizon TaxID=34254 RepID=A0AAV3RMU2_LITER
MDLTFVTPKAGSSKPMVEMPTLVVMAGVEKWQHTLIPYFWGAILVIQKWKDLCEIAEALSPAELRLHFAHRTTSEQRRLAYARVSVEVGVDNDLFDDITGNTPQVKSMCRRYELIDSGLSLSPIEEQGLPGSGPKSTYVVVVATPMVPNNQKLSRNAYRGFGSNKSSLKGHTTHPPPHRY